MLYFIWWTILTISLYNLLFINIKILMVAFIFALTMLCMFFILFLFLIIIMLLTFIYNLLSNEKLLQEYRAKLFILKIMFIFSVNYTLQSIPEEWKKWLQSPDLKFIIVVLIYAWFFFTYMY